MRVLVLAFAIVVGAAAATAQEAEPPDIDSEARAMAREALEPIAAARSLDVQFRTLYDVVQEEGHKLQFASRARVWIRRPDRARLTTVRDDGRQREVRYDGETFSVYDRGENVYGRFPVPDTLDATLDYVELEIGMPMTLADLFYEDLSHLQGMAVSGERVGTSRVGEWSCDHLSFRGEHVDWQLWVEQGEERRLREFVITYHGEPGAPQFVAVFDRWVMDAELADEAFVFSPPEGAERIPVLARPLAAGAPR